MSEMTEAARKFIAINNKQPVVFGYAKTGGGGGGYMFKSGRLVILTLDDVRSLPSGYPKWPWDFAEEQR